MRKYEKYTKSTPEKNKGMQKMEYLFQNIMITLEVVH